ncbi:MAG: arginine--tRNA ligase [Oscillospiraceae bacterium]|jgi:arginyl-tRNA synthetase|nr:arginine--tRNA ligase [Oscillospiraceae bacterium]
MNFKRHLANTIHGILPTDDAPVELIESYLEVPKDSSMGDFALPCFRFAKTFKKPPQAIAQTIADGWNDESSEAAAVSGYLNIKLNPVFIARNVIADVLGARGKFASSDEGAGKTICIDYSSVNIAKRFHIGHLSTTMIGHSLKRIFDHLGYTTVGINHLGDWGTQFGKMISAYKRWGSREDVELRGIQAIVDLYVRFHDEAKDNPALEDEGREWFLRIERGDTEALEIFEWLKELTMNDVAKIYDQLGVSFDHYTGESFYKDKMQPVVDELREKNLLEQSEGAWVVDLTPDKMPPCLILKRDGATLYPTRDLAAAEYRADTFNFHKSLYVVAYQQDLHFRQVFRVLEKMGKPWARDLVHVSYGMVSYGGAALSTRDGHTVYLEDVLAEARAKARRIIDEKSPDLQDKDAAAKSVGIGAVVYSVLSAGRIKDIDFRWDSALNFDGETGPYVQYAHARCCSLLSKAEEAGLTVEECGKNWNADALANPEATEVLLLISRFPELVRDAARKYEPSMVTRHVTDIAGAYNKFYFEHRVLQGDIESQAARVLLTEAARIAIATGLMLIGVDAPTRM